jgi:NAD(P)-dependent dehydrogenase (short-subunit alcohol dehydrogenase family)
VRWRALWYSRYQVDVEQHRPDDLAHIRISNENERRKVLTFLTYLSETTRSQFYGMKTVMAGMRAAGGGSIVNVSSVAGMVSIVGAPNIAYVGSKFAVRGMTKHVAVEVGPHNIRVNSVHPGYIKTPMMAAATDEQVCCSANLSGVEILTGLLYCRAAESRPWCPSGGWRSRPKSRASFSSWLRTSPRTSRGWSTLLMEVSPPRESAYCNLVGRLVVEGP